MRIKILILIAAVLLIAVNFISGFPGKNDSISHYTIMIYMNGSDLESEIGAATVDLAEILESGLRGADVIILTGGTLYWQNPVVPAATCTLWHIADGELHKLEEWGSLNMGAPQTLSRFISHTRDFFPADKYGLILWDHGGGAIAGYGHDELHYDSALTLPDLDEAFSEAGLAENKLEWLGFDSCLMATVEMAVISAPYARYLIASEDLEPADGWDYSFLSVLNRNPQADGLEVGTEIVDSFMAFYGPDADEVLTLSVTDLSQIAPITTAMDALMAQARGKLDRGFEALASKRQATKTFGEASPRDNYSDMVDIGDMAHQLHSLFPYESDNLLNALKKAVKYNRHNSETELYGLSSFYIYGGISTGVQSLALYRELAANGEYTRYLEDFLNMLLLAPRTDCTCVRQSLWQKAAKPGNYIMLGWQQKEAPCGELLLWPQIEGRFVCLYPCSDGRFAIPAMLNGTDGDIITKGGKLLGFRPLESAVKQKGLTALQTGDTVAFWHPHRNFIRGETSWQPGEQFALKNSPALSYSKPSGQFFHCTIESDATGRHHYGPLKYVEY